MATEWTSAIRGTKLKSEVDFKAAKPEDRVAAPLIDTAGDGQRTSFAESLKRTDIFLGCVRREQREPSAEQLAKKPDSKPMVERYYQWKSLDQKLGVEIKTRAFLPKALDPSANSFVVYMKVRFDNAPEQFDQMVKTLEFYQIPHMLPDDKNRHMGHDIVNFKYSELNDVLNSNQLLPADIRFSILQALHRHGIGLDHNRPWRQPSSSMSK